MPHRKEFIDIVRGITNSFNSRNNDFQGYWALGILYKFARMNNLNSLEFDLLNQTIQPEIEYFQKIISKYRSYLQRLLNAKNINQKWLKSATVTIDFNGYNKQHHALIEYPVGDPYVIIGKLIDDKGTIFESTIYGKCRSHDPTKEQRSSRVNKK